MLPRPPQPISARRTVSPGLRGAAMAGKASEAAVAAPVRFKNRRRLEPTETSWTR
ncbi:MAG: hypothetical protein VX588_03845 [Verrucomicrobiota bacterium]|nr:hypothetical protein [Verrucomicrobiota bacterium]